MFLDPRWKLSLGQLPARTFVQPLAPIRFRPPLSRPGPDPWSPVGSWLNLSGGLGEVAFLLPIARRHRGLISQKAFVKSVAIPQAGGRDQWLLFPVCPTETFGYHCAAKGRADKHSVARSPCLVYRTKFTRSVPDTSGLWTALSHRACWNSRQSSRHSAGGGELKVSWALLLCRLKGAFSSDGYADPWPWNECVTRMWLLSPSAAVPL